MASSNPFRRKSTILTTSTETTDRDESRFPPLEDIDTSVPTPPPQTSFRNGQIPDAPVADEKTKPVKQVRILSPPPISPDSPGWSFTAKPLVVDGDQPRDDDDPFEEAPADDSDREMVSGNAPPQNSGWIPPNPFNRTLKDVESVEGEQHLKKERRGEAAALKAGNIARRSLDVNAFKRLLMTGDSGSGSSGSATPPRAQQLKFGHQRSATETFSVSPVPSYSGAKENKHSDIQLQETSLISNEISESPSEGGDDASISDSSVSLHTSKDKKPPPPPSSRHGKSIKLELGEDPDASQRPRSKSPSDVNKPLPAPPVRKSFDDSESPFDKESAGKVPELDTPIVSQSSFGSAKKAVPIPPPRRGHARAESKANAAMSSSTGQNMSRSFEDEPPSRASMDSVRSRSERNRNEGQAPAPLPPPRRSTGSRQSSHILSPIPSTLDEPSSTSSTPQIPLDKSLFSPPLPHTSSLDQSTFREVHSGTPKLAAPPPPPARNPSVRRPASVRSVDSTSRRISAEVKPHNSMAPPPPPRRQRGNSRSSLDGQQQQPRRTSFDNYSAAPPLDEESTPDVSQDGVGVSDPAVSTSPQSAVVVGKGADILADLDALQREVDALRGKLK